MASLILFFSGMLIGGVSEYIFSSIFIYFTNTHFKKQSKFSLGNKVSFFSFPIWGLIFLLISKNINYILLFIYCAVIGTFLESIMGTLVKNIYRIKIWKYQYGAIGNFTSIYSIPYWGAAGIIFASIGKLIGL